MTSRRGSELQEGGPFLYKDAASTRLHSRQAARAWISENNPQISGTPSEGPVERWVGVTAGVPLVSSSCVVHCCPDTLCRIEFVVGLFRPTPPEVKAGWRYFQVGENRIAQQVGS